jgi:hypothetical protein
VGLATVDTHGRDEGPGLVVGEAGGRPRRSLVIVASDQPALHDYLTRQFASDPRVVVLMDRRRGDGSQALPSAPRPERRRRTGYDHDVRLHWVVVVREQRDPRASSERAETALETGAGTVEALDAEIRTTQDEITRLRGRLVALRREVTVLRRRDDASPAPDRSRDADRAEPA